MLCADCAQPQVGNRNSRVQQGWVIRGVWACEAHEGTVDAVC
jgi:hypothetical protein